MCTTILLIGGRKSNSGCCGDTCVKLSLGGQEATWVWHAVNQDKHAKANISVRLDLFKWHSWDCVFLLTSIQLECFMRANICSSCNNTCALALFTCDGFCSACSNCWFYSSFYCFLKKYIYVLLWCYNHRAPCAMVMDVYKGKVLRTYKSLVAEMLKLNLPLSQENVCIFTQTSSF